MFISILIELSLKEKNLIRTSADKRPAVYQVHLT